jgi:general secretion pathway protein H
MKHIGSEGPERVGMVLNVKRSTLNVKRVSGFTLIEVMIVLTIVAVVATTFTLNLDSRRSPADEVERLRRVLEACAERAEIRGTPMAVDFVAQGYRVSTYDTQGNWTPVRGESQFAEQSVPDLAWAGLTVDGQDASPRLVFGSEMPDFVLRVAAPSGDLRLSGLPTGAVRLEKGPAS